MIRHTVAYGHKVGDQVIGAGGSLHNLALPVKTGYQMVMSRKSFLCPIRKPMSAATGFEFADAAPIRSDLDATENFAGSAAKRIASKPNPIHAPTFKRLCSFIDRWLENNVAPLPYDVDLSFHTWIENTNYSRRRKLMLTEMHEKRFDSPLLPEHVRVKMFGKDETYGDWKFMRGILPRSDYFKIHLGPIMKQIELVLYELPYFIKHIPEKDRPRYVMENVYQPGAKNFVSDHTSFEAAFTGEIMKNIEKRLYMHMLSNLPEKYAIEELIDVLCQVNTIEGKDCVFKSEGRMSGEMCTSLGNGFSNLMVMLFALEEAGCESVRGVVEGDDGLFTFFGNPPTVHDFARIGFRLKLEVFDSFSEASFCGMLFDETDQIILTDAVDSVLKMGWSSRQYIMASERTRSKLLRSKAMSYAHMYWNCPIIGAASRAALRLTSDISENELKRFRSKEQISIYEFEERELNESVQLGDTFIPMNTRVLYEKLFGVSISDQLRIEEWFDNLNYLSNLRCPFLSPYFTKQSIDYNNIYVVREDHLFRFPPIPDNRRIRDVRNILVNVRLR